MEAVLVEVKAWLLLVEREQELVETKRVEM